jgi:hypothetical protein
VTRWTTSALPVLSKLTGDCTAIENNSGPASASSAGARRDMAARYQVDLAATERLGAPPDSTLAQEWGSMLRQLTAAEAELETFTGADEEATAGTHLRFVAVGTVLLQFEQAIRPAQ